MFSGHNAYPLRLRPVLLERVHPDREAAGGAHPDRPLAVPVGRGARMTEAARAVPAILRALLLLVFAFVVIKAASSDLTWDELWSYLFYGRTPLGFTRLDYANDHPLNSILIWAATRMFGNSEFIIRIPNVLAGGLYLYSTAKLIGAVRCKLLAFALCALQPYLMDYFALARGYGIAASLVQFGLVAHFFGPRPRPALMLVSCLLASLTVFSTLVMLYALLGSLVIMAIVARSAAAAPRFSTAAAVARRCDGTRELGGGRGGHSVAVLTVVFGMLGLVPVAGLLRVSREGLPLYRLDRRILRCDRPWVRPDVCA